MGLSAEQREFVELVRTAIGNAKAQGAVLNARAATAQACLESFRGSTISTLARRHNNLYGIKKGSSWTGPVIEYQTKEYDASRGYYTVVAAFREYESFSACLMDYAHLIATRSWFKDALPHADPPQGDGDPQGWWVNIAPEPGEPGWGTGPDYGRAAAYWLRQIENGEPVTHGISVVVEGTKLPIGTVRTIDGQVWVKARAAFEAAGMSVAWDPQKQQVIVEAE